jgi:tetratricopeptide (TPR) repeat protein
MDYTRAEESMLKAVELEPEVAYHHDLLGDVYRAQGDLEKALEQYTRAVELAPGKPDPLGQRGYVNCFLGNYDEARADFAAAADAGSGNQKSVYARIRALVWVYAGDAEGAIEELSSIVDEIDGMGVPEPLGQKIGTLFQIGMIAQHHGMLDVADDAFAQRAQYQEERWESVGEESFTRGQQANIAYWEGIVAARRGDYSTATARANEFMQLLEPDANPRKNEPAHFVLGLASYLQGDHTTALEHFDQSFPNDVYAKYYRALAHEGAGNDTEAAALFNELATYNFGSVGYALIRQDAIEKAP